MTPVRTLALLAASAFAGTAAAAAPWPAQPVTIVVPFPPGGGTDIVARLLANKLQPALGQAVLVENRPGAATAIGARAVAAAKPDGYTLLLSGSSTYAVVPALRSDLPYDPLKSFAPIAIVADAPLALLVSNQSGIKSVPELVKTFQSDPQKGMYATFGSGSAPHLAGAMFAETLKVSLTPVPYRGSGPAMTALMGGEVPLSFDTIAASAPQARAGSVRALAVTGDRPSPSLPGVPTYAELGIGDASMVGWYALAAPAGTPAPVLDAIYAAVKTAMEDPQVKESFVTNGLDPVLVDAEGFRERMERELKQFAEVARRSNITME